VEAYEWFGYKLHILVGSPHEVALAHKVTSARVADNEVLGELLEDGKTLRVKCELDFPRFPPDPAGHAPGHGPRAQGRAGPDAAQEGCGSTARQARPRLRVTFCPEAFCTIPPANTDAPPTYAARSIMVRGWIDGCALLFSGNVRSVSAGGMRDSALFAGVTGTTLTLRLRSLATCM